MSFLTPHAHCLREICRLCGQQRTLTEGRQPIPKSTSARQIQAAFSINVEEDDDKVHPPFICKVCQLRLNRWWQKVTYKKKKNEVCSIELATFEDTECEKCRGGTQPASTDDQLVAYEEIGRECGLVTWFAGQKQQIVKLDVHGYPVAYFTIHSDLTWEISVADVKVEEDRFGLAIGTKLDVTGARKICDLLVGRQVCRGSDDYGELVDLRRGSEGQTPLSITPQDVYVRGTIRHNRCRLLVEDTPSQRCDVCTIHRSDLAALEGRLKAKKSTIITASSTVPNKSMTHQQLQQKASSLQADRRRLKRKNRALHEKVSSLMRDESVEVDAFQDTVLSEILNEEDEVVKDVLPEGSLARLLWDQQKMSASKGKQMRWHPAVIRWCIALRSKSSSAYDLMRESGFLRLPHPTTLHPYTHFADPTPGFNPALLKRIVQDFNLESRSDDEKDVALLFDEMKVKSGLVYSVRSGKLVGFTDMGDIDNEVRSFENRCKDDSEVHLATHVLVLMLRGLFSNLHVPVGYYPSEGVSSSQLYPCLYEAVTFVETAGFKVRAFVSDGASPNRKFYRLSECDAEGSTKYFTHHPLDESRKIFFICDVPHLMKTTRNNWENSGFHNKTKQLVYNKQSITWPQLLQLYEWDLSLERTSPGLRRLHKINHDHLHLTPAHRMRVYMATQVLSSTVANCFESVGRTDTASTVKFIRYMDQFFDCLNVTNLHQGSHSRKPALAPYTSPDDWRFEWLTKDFLGFLKEWEDQVQALPVDQKMKKSMFLSKETVEGLRITVMSFVELARSLLGRPGERFFLSEKLNQDPLEEYFSKQRGAGGSWDNPTVGEVGHHMLALYVASDCIKASRKGNTRKLDRDDDSAAGSSIDNTPLPRRK